MGRPAVNAAKKAVTPITHFEDLNSKQNGRFPASIVSSSIEDKESKMKLKNVEYNGDAEV